jgi:hypothetical protein
MTFVVWITPSQLLGTTAQHYFNFEEVGLVHSEQLLIFQFVM